MSLVKTTITKPDLTTGEFAWRNILWEPIPLHFEIALQDKDGKLINPAGVLINPKEVPFQLFLIPPSGEKDKIGPLDIVAGSQPGVYLADFQTYQPFVWYAQRNLGAYNLEIIQTGTLKEMYIYENVKIIPINLTRAKLWWLLPVIILVAGLVLLGLALLNIYRSLWPSIGTISVQCPNLPAWSRRLGDAGKHTQIFSGAAAPSCMKRLYVQQILNKREIKVTAYLRKGAKTTRIMQNDQVAAFAPNVMVGYRTMQAERTPTISINIAVFSLGFASLLLILAVCGTIFAIVASLT